MIEDVYADVLASLPDDERDVFVRALQRLVAGRLARPSPRAWCAAGAARPPGRHRVALS